MCGCLYIQSCTNIWYHTKLRIRVPLNDLFAISLHFPHAEMPLLVGRLPCMAGVASEELFCSCTGLLPSSDDDDGSPLAALRRSSAARSRASRASSSAFCDVSACCLSERQHAED